MIRKKFPLCEYLQEEMEVREWTDADLYSRLPDPVDQCAAFLAIYGENNKTILDDHTAKVLSRLFDVSSELFKNLNNAQREKL